MWSQYQKSTMLNQHSRYALGYFKRACFKQSQNAFAAISSRAIHSNVKKQDKTNPGKVVFSNERQNKPAVLFIHSIFMILQ